MEALILGGMTPSQAMTKMSQRQFQEAILEELSSLLGVEAEELEKTQSKVESNGDPTGVAFLIASIEIHASSPTEKITQAQELLRRFARMQQYLAKFPDEKAALSVLLTLAQGPKGMLQVLVQNAAAGTEVGQYIEQKGAAVQAEFGKSLAAYRKLNSDIADDVFVIGGGDLMVEILTGSIPGGKREVERTHVSVEGSGGLKGTAELNAQVSLVVRKVNAPIDFDGHVLSAEINPMGMLLVGIQQRRGMLR